MRPVLWHCAESCSSKVPFWCPINALERTTAKRIGGSFHCFLLCPTRLARCRASQARGDMRPAYRGLRDAERLAGDGHTAQRSQHTQQDLSGARTFVRQRSSSCDRTFAWSGGQTRFWAKPSDKTAVNSADDQPLAPSIEGEYHELQGLGVLPPSRVHQFHRRRLHFGPLCANQSDDPNSPNGQCV
jgi:hypothetical protein